ncbi:PREDICTED: proline-rich protein 36-like [Tarenaya hassleriana]|uniref:proline-rich protein 36-like n=1 Tax=Tarenaya hassleriana TaxID=28532 RepID=UPI00053C9371|nr:PREDICTED: proline-rich protein 36-like [Tarenaya hassleriana]
MAKKKSNKSPTARKKSSKSPPVFPSAPPPEQLCVDHPTPLPAIAAPGSLSLPPATSPSVVPEQLMPPITSTFLPSDFPPLPSPSGQAPSSSLAPASPCIQVPPLSSAPLADRVMSAAPQAISATVSSGNSNLKFPWADRLRQASRNLSRLAKPVFSAEATREWALEIGIWRVADVMFALSEWTPTSTLRKHALTSVPIWITLRNIPPEMFSLQGISYIASGLGEPLHTERMRLDPLQIGEARVKVEIHLGETLNLPPAVEVEDDAGAIIKVDVNYAWLPPRCISCSEFGHSHRHCPAKSPTQPQAQVSPVIQPSTPNSEKVIIPVSDCVDTPKSPVIVPQHSQSKPSQPVTITSFSTSKSIDVVEIPNNPSPTLTIVSSEPITDTGTPLPLPSVQPQATLPQKFCFDSDEELVAEAQRILRARSSVAATAQKSQYSLRSCVNNVILDPSDFTLVGKARKGRGNF